MTNVFDQERRRRRIIEEILEPSLFRMEPDGNEVSIVYFWQTAARKDYPQEIITSILSAAADLMRGRGLRVHWTVDKRSLRVRGG